MFQMLMSLNHSNGGYDLITLCEAKYLLVKVVRMAGIAKMRYAFIVAYDTIRYILIMPTEREHSKHNPEPDDHNPELEHDNTPSSRLKFLDYAETVMYNFCIGCFIIKSSIVALAIYGLYKIIF